MSAFFGLDGSKECSNSLYFTPDQQRYCEETHDMNQVFFTLKFVNTKILRKMFELELQENFCDFIIFVFPYK